MHPGVVNITLGRQLFVDSFLLHNTSQIRIMHHSATWSNDGPVLHADQPWEHNPTTVPPGSTSWPSKGRIDVISNVKPYSGGLWWDEERRVYRLYYLCPLANTTATPEVPWGRIRRHSWTGGQLDGLALTRTLTPALTLTLTRTPTLTLKLTRNPDSNPNPGLCVAFSADAKTWTKPILDDAVVPKTNIVLDQISDGITVWRDDDPGVTAEERWVAAAVPEEMASPNPALSN